MKMQNKQEAKHAKLDELRVEYNHKMEVIE